MECLFPGKIYLYSQDFYQRLASCLASFGVRRLFLAIFTLLVTDLFFYSEIPKIIHWIAVHLPFCISYLRAREYSLSSLILLFSLGDVSTKTCHFILLSVC